MHRYIIDYEVWHYSKMIDWGNVSMETEEPNGKKLIENIQKLVSETSGVAGAKGRIVGLFEL